MGRGDHQALHQRQRTEQGSDASFDEGNRTQHPGKRPERLYELACRHRKTAHRRRLCRTGKGGIRALQHAVRSGFHHQEGLDTVAGKRLAERSGTACGTVEREHGKDNPQAASRTSRKRKFRSIRAGIRHPDAGRSRPDPIAR